MKSKLELAPTTRDLRLDSLRGLFIVFMTINHLPTGLRTWTDQSLGIFTAAEGFVFLSGLLAGLVYTRKLRKLGFPAFRQASVNRAQTIYNWHLGSFFVAFLVVQATMRIFGYCSQTSPQLFYANPILALGLGSILLYQPGLLDLLPMYCVFILLIPLTVPLLEQGKRGRVLILSAIVWLVAQNSPPIDGAPLYPVNVGTFNLFAWQFLFIVGIVIGHARASGLAQVSKPSLGVVLAALAVVAYGWGLHHRQWPRAWPDQLFGILVNKPALGLFRLANFGCAAYLVGILAERMPRLFSWSPLETLGRNSLQVVAAQSVIVMVLLQFSSLYTTPLRRNATAILAVTLLLVLAYLYRGWQLRNAPKAVVEPMRTPPLPLDSPHDVRAA